MDQLHETEHLIRLEKIHPSGAEEWHCVYCNRRIIKQREPVEHQIVLDNGVISDAAAQNIKDTEISHDLWLTLEKILHSAEMAW